jgi:hypothetical protein
MSNIAGLPNTNVGALTPALNANIAISKMYGSFLMKLFTSNEIIDNIDRGFDQFDAINVKMNPILADAEVITDITTGTNTYADLNYGKVVVTLDEALSSKYKYNNAQQSVNPLDYEKAGSEASGSAMARAYEKGVYRKMKNSVGANVLGTIGTPMNRALLTALRVDADNKGFLNERIYVGLLPDLYAQLGNIAELAQTSYRLAETIDGLDESQSFSVGGNFNMTFFKTPYIERPVPATDPFAIGFVKRSVVTPIRPVKLSGTGVDLLKTFGNVSMTHTTLPVSDARLGVSVLKKNEALWGFKEIPYDIDTAGTTSGKAIWLIRGGI